jgi:hypothetical protein
VADRGNVVIIGAGAIGRGYLPWVVDHDLVFVDNNPQIIRPMRERKRYRSYRVRDGKLESRDVPVLDACLPDELDWRKYDPRAVFVNVGPRQVARIARLLEGIRCPVILCENDPATVDLVKGSVFAVPDVITSNTAPAELLAQDSLSTVTEDGVLFADSRAQGSVRGEITWLPTRELVDQQWTAKLYLHNTPHCVTAYLGALAGSRYVHEAMAKPEIARIVSGSMNEMLIALKLKWEIPHEFLDWYAEKELRRFANVLLYDPVSRVAREPLRKLDPDGRLIGAAQICLASGFIPHNILIGIAGALLFKDEQDSDRHLDFMRGALSPDIFLTHVLNLRRGEALEILLRERMEKIVRIVEGVRA